MKNEVSLPELYEPVRLLSEIASSQNLIEESQLLLFDGGEVYANNGHVWGRAPCPFLDCPVLVNAKGLLKILESFNGFETVSLSLAKPKLLIASSGRKASIVTTNEMDLAIPFLKDGFPSCPDLTPIQEEHVQALQFAGTLAHHESPSVSVFSCVRFYSDKNLVIEAGDNYQFFRQYLPIPLGSKEDMRVESKALLIALKSAPKTVGLDKRFLIMSGERGTFALRKTDGGTWPDFDQVMPEEGRTIAFPNKKLSQVLKRIAPYTKPIGLLGTEDVRYASIQVKDGSMKVRAGAEELWIEEDVKVRSEEEWSFLVRPNIFQSLIQTGSSFFITEDGKLMSTKKDGTQFTIVLNNR